jgi:plastocyanin
MRTLLTSLVALSTLATFFACSDTPSGGTPVTPGPDAQTPGMDSGSMGADSGAKMDASMQMDASNMDSGTTSMDSGMDAAVSELDLNGCSAALYKDETANTDVMITWGFGTTPAGGSCITVKQGSDVTWNGNLAFHPLAASGGGAMTPIVGASTGTSVTYTFDDLGVFGYVCGVHASMTGVINVVP